MDSSCQSATNSTLEVEFVAYYMGTERIQSVSGFHGNHLNIHRVLPVSYKLNP